jgi:hypothetical protein
MKRTTRTLLTAAGALFITAVALLASASAALAQHVPDRREGSGVASTAPQPAANAMAAGSPLWTFIVVALLTAFVTALLTVIAVRRLDRPARPARPLAA